jgi:hypothetical protein
MNIVNSYFRRFKGRPFYNTFTMLGLVIGLA